MTQDLQTAIKRLQSLPESDQLRIASSINEYLNNLENLRQMIQDGVDSGPATKWDFERFREEVRERLKREDRRINGED